MPSTVPHEWPRSTTFSLPNRLLTSVTTSSKSLTNCAMVHGAGWGRRRQKERPVPRCSQYTIKKCFFEFTVVMAKKGRLARTRPPAQEDKSRVVGAHAAKPEHLRYTADVDLFHRGDAAGDGASLSVPKRFGMDARGERRKQKRYHKHDCAS